MYVTVSMCFLIYSSSGSLWKVQIEDSYFLKLYWWKRCRHWNRWNPFQESLKKHPVCTHFHYHCSIHLLYVKLCFVSALSCCPVVQASLTEVTLNTFVRLWGSSLRRPTSVWRARSMRWVSLSFNNPQDLVHQLVELEGKNSKIHHTVGGRNPAPPNMYETL